MFFLPSSSSCSYIAATHCCCIGAGQCVVQLVENSLAGGGAAVTVNEQGCQSACGATRPSHSGHTPTRNSFFPPNKDNHSGYHSVLLIRIHRSTEKRVVFATISGKPECASVHIPWKDDLDISFSTGDLQSR